MTGPRIVIGRAAMLFAAALLLQSCADVSRKHDADETAVDLLAHCEGLYQLGKLKTHVAVVDCAIPKTIDAYTAAAYPFMDLIYVSLEARRNGADRIDHGQVKEADVEHEMTVLQTRIDAEEKRREGIVSVGGGVTKPEPETLVAGLDALTPLPRSKPLPPETDCTTIGPFGQCD